MAVSTKKDRRTYNERLFQGRNLRSFLHNARFEWFRRRVEQRLPNAFSMVELGCFDGRLLEFCPHSPVRYEGFDADWEGGLSTALEKFANHPYWRFHKALDASALRPLPAASFDVAAALETLEHIPPGSVDDYLAELARVTDGWLFVTVPNEKGLVFLAKYAAKRFALRSAQSYRPAEVWNATLGRMHLVERVEHKGFDWQQLSGQIARHFEIDKIESIPFAGSPLGTAFTIGIIARPRSCGGRTLGNRSIVIDRKQR
jgi:hypothetical protein